jgi:hypothetical protein
VARHHSCKLKLTFLNYVDVFDRVILLVNKLLAVKVDLNHAISQLLSKPFVHILEVRNTRQKVQHLNSVTQINIVQCALEVFPFQNSEFCLVLGALDSGDACAMLLCKRNIAEACSSLQRCSLTIVHTVVVVKIQTGVTYLMPRYY